MMDPDALRNRIAALIAGAAIAPLSWPQAYTVAGTVLKLVTEHNAGGFDATHGFFTEIEKS